MKILVTGGCGFIGSNLAIFLKEKIKTRDHTEIMLNELGAKISSNSHIIINPLDRDLKPYQSHQYLQY